MAAKPALSGLANSPPKQIKQTPIKPSWYKKRHYLHFDSPIGFRKTQAIVTSPPQVAKHAFYPFISLTITSKSVKKDAAQKLVANIKARPVAYASHLDSHIYSYYAEQLQKRYEAYLLHQNLSNSVLAFRSLGKCNINFAKEAFDNIRGQQNCVAIALDITGFFDHLDHAYLKQQWCSLLNLKQLPNDHYNVFKSLTKHSSVNRDALYAKFGISLNNPRAPNQQHFRICTAQQFRESVRAAGLAATNKNNYGIPQGSPISALLSNIYMMEFDAAMHAYVVQKGGSYRRYCDDILLVLPSGEELNAITKVEELLDVTKLKLNASKTCIRTFSNTNEGQKADKPLQYLGFTFDGQQILIRSAAFARYSNRMNRAVRLAKKTQASANRQRAAKGLPDQPLYKQKLYSKYTCLGKRNFITYGLRAAEIMESDAIRRQLRPWWGRLQEKMSKT